MTFINFFRRCSTLKEGLGVSNSRLGVFISCPSSNSYSVGGEVTRRSAHSTCRFCERHSDGARHSPSLSLSSSRFLRKRQSRTTVLLTSHRVCFKIRPGDPPCWRELWLDWVYIRRKRRNLGVYSALQIQYYSSTHPMWI